MDLAFGFWLILAALTRLPPETFSEHISEICFAISSFRGSRNLELFFCIFPIMFAQRELANTPFHRLATHQKRLLQQIWENRTAFDEFQYAAGLAGALTLAGLSIDDRQAVLVVAKLQHYLTS